MVELTGDPEALEAMLVESPPGATILLLGVPSMRQRFPFESFVGFDKTLVGSMGSGVTELSEVVDLLPQVELDAYFQNIVPLGEFEAALTSARHREHLKTLLKVEAV